MTSIDELFRKPNAGPKRKLEDPNASFLQHHKAAKLSNGASPHNSNNTATGSLTNGSRRAFVEDAAETGEERAELEAEDNNDDDDDNDIEAGPALPPDSEDGDEEEDANEDDEGRFFGGGVTAQEKKVLDFIESNEDASAEEEKIDMSWLKKTTLNFERKISKNAELRAKYEDDPMKFVGSEADLDGEVKGLSLLSEHPGLYAGFVRSGCVGSLVGLLAHENTDIAISVCELMAELTDEDSGADGEQWKVLVDAMMDADVVDLLVSNLERLDEVNNETDRSGVYHVLNVVENLMSEPSNVEKFGKSTKLLKWLRDRVKTPDPDARAKVGQNRQYAAEILAILLQGGDANRSRFADIDGIDVLLQLLSVYRKRDPEKDSDEEEFVENLFDCLVAVVKDSEGAMKFLDGEGMELCLIMVREGKLSRSRSFRVLDHALGGVQGGLIGERLVEAAGLKTLFSIFMKTKKSDREAIEHLIGIFSSLLRYLPAESAARIRSLAKFVEKDYEKARRLLELRRDYASRVNAVNKQISSERQKLSAEDIEGMQPEWLSRRFDAGLFSLQTLDVLLAWLIAEDDGARSRIFELMSSESLDGQKVLKLSLQEQIKDMDSDQGSDTKEMLEALLRCLA